MESGVFASCPELCFVQLAQSLPFHELVRAGNVLCGRFYLDAGKGGELGRREPLTSKRRIEAFLRANPGIKGVKEARRALPWVTEGAASPPEAFLAMVFGLPYRRRLSALRPCGKPAVAAEPQGSADSTPHHARP